MLDLGAVLVHYALGLLDCFVVLGAFVSLYNISLIHIRLIIHFRILRSFHLVSCAVYRGKLPRVIMCSASRSANCALFYPGLHSDLIGAEVFGSLGL